MNTKRKTILLSLLCFFTLNLTNTAFAQEKQGKKKRIAVLTFDDKTDGSGRWWHYKHVGDGVTDMIVTELVKDGQYKVIERTQINKLIQEQQLQNSGFVSEQSAVELGKLLGVELAIFGAVSEFGYSKGKQKVGLTKLKLGVGKNKAVVAIDLRIINVETGEILSADNVREEKSSTSVGVNTRKVNYSNQKQFDESIVGKAARAAVERIIKVIDNSAAQVKWAAKVITLQGGKVYINSGSLDGVAVGETFSVFRPGQKLIDPDTGLELGSIDEKIGQIKVVDNSVGNGKASICEIVTGDMFVKGDVVKEN